MILPNERSDFDAVLFAGPVLLRWEVSGVLEAAVGFPGRVLSRENGSSGRFLQWYSVRNELADFIWVGRLWFQQAALNSAILKLYIRVCILVCLFWYGFLR